MVGTWNIVWLAVSAILSIGAPITLLFYLRHRFGVSWRAVGSGVLVFVVFVFVLEALINVTVLRWNPHAAQWFKSPYVYALYGCLMAALFEEGGRLFAYKVLLKRQRAWKDGVSYGIGHGGFEAVVLGGLSSIGNLVFAVQINTGKLAATMAAQPAAAAKLQAVKAAMLATPASMDAVAGIERLLAFTIQIGLSLLVLYAVRTGSMKWFAAAFGTHAFVDFFAGLTQRHVMSIWVAEMVSLVVALVLLVWIVRSRRLFTGDDEKRMSLGV